MELKSTIQKLMESHLAEKKRMVEKFEQETENYSKYYQFFHDNAEKLDQLEEEYEEIMKNKKGLEEQVKQLQMKLSHEQQKSPSNNS